MKVEATFFRRIIRRALLHCHKLNKDKKILSNLLNNVIEDYSSVYYSLSNTFDFIYKNLKIEEDKFCETLSNGLQLLNKEINEMKGDTFAPSVAFKLYDTYGFPLDMTESILLERKIKLDKNEYLKIVKDNKNLQKNFVSGEKVENVNKILSQLENVTEDTKLADMTKIN